MLNWNKLTYWTIARDLFFHTSFEHLSPLSIVRVLLAEHDNQQIRCSSYKQTEYSLTMRFFVKRFLSEAETGSSTNSAEQIEEVLLPFLQFSLYQI